MSNPHKGYRIWGQVTEAGLIEIYEVASLMPALEPSGRVVWHACELDSEKATICGIRFDALRDPLRLQDHARAECSCCRRGYERRFGAGAWVEGLAQTLAKVTELADRSRF